MAFHREDVTFLTNDGVELSGWLYKPGGSTGEELPCLVMSHGFAGVKELSLDKFAEYFVTRLAIACLVYDHRGFGASGGQPRQDIDPARQVSDFSEAITYAQSRTDINADRIGIWGTSLSGGHVVKVGAVDRRVKAVLSQVPMSDGFEIVGRNIRPDFLVELNKNVQAARLSFLKPREHVTVPVSDPNPLAMAALPSLDSHIYFKPFEDKGVWKNEVTLLSLDRLRGHNPLAWAHRISPTPLLVTVALHDTVTPTDLCLKLFHQVQEPKELSLIPGGHFDPYSGKTFEINAARQLEFLRKHLLN